MAKYTIHWDAGCGKSTEIIEADSLEIAELEAYGRWKEEAENEADYGAKQYEEGDEDLL
jgi:predicted secreted protein